MTTRICETHRRPGPAVGRRGAALRTRLSAELERLPRVVAKTEGIFPRWAARDRRVQRLRCWLGGAAG